MAHDVFDLVVRVRNELRTMGDLHPADRNAFIFGVISGLRFGERRLKASTEIASGQMVDVLSDTSTELPEMMFKANDFMPTDEFLDASLFFRLSYRTSGSKKYYSQGIRLGFSYTMDLYEALGGCLGNEIAQKDSLEHVRATISTMINGFNH